MKRALKAVVLSGVVAATLAAPVSPANAATCVGIEMNHGLQNAGAWNCSPCPEMLYGPLDGRFQVILCFTVN